MPPLEYRTWVGPTEDSSYENPDLVVYPDFPPERYESVFDFGCGCGRVARQLILQRPRPKRYVGIDLHPELIAWCQANLEPAAPGFSFRHHDVLDRLANAGEGKPDVLPFPAPDDSVTLFEALSIFTHIPQRHMPFYLGEAARVLAPGGEMNASFLLFEKADFAALAFDPGRNALYIDDQDPPPPSTSTATVDLLDLADDHQGRPWPPRPAVTSGASSSPPPAEQPTCALNPVVLRLAILLAAKSKASVLASRPVQAA